MLICTYNERQNLPTLTQQIAHVVPQAHVLIVDDHSPDGTGEWVREAMEHNPQLHWIDRPGKLGLGTAIRAGMEYAIEGNYRWLVNLDADWSHDPQVMREMLELREQADVVIGSRWIPGGGMMGCSWRRVFVSQCANRYARWIIGWSIRDCSSAFRMYRVESLKGLALDRLIGVGYGFLEEVLWHLLNVHARVKEIPIVYTERKHGKSKISVREAWSTVRSIHHVARLQRASK